MLPPFFIDDTGTGRALEPFLPHIAESSYTGSLAWPGTMAVVHSFLLPVPASGQQGTPGFGWGGGGSGQGVGTERKKVCATTTIGGGCVLLMQLLPIASSWSGARGALGPFPHPQISQKQQQWCQQGVGTPPVHLVPILLPGVPC